MFSLKLDKASHNPYHIGAHADNYFAGETETYTVKGLPSICKDSKGEVIASKSFQRFWCRSMKDITRTVKVIDMRQAPLDQWLINPVENSVLPMFDVELRAQFQRQHLYNEKINLSAMTLEQQALINACFKIETFLLTFAEVAHELHERLNPLAQKALAIKHSECSNEKFTLNRLNVVDIPEVTKLPSESAPDIRIAIAKQDKCRLPNFKEWTEHVQIKKGKLLDKLLTKKLKEAGFPDANPQVFIGFVNPVIADVKAKRELFMDDSCSSYPLHGQRTHLFQILALGRAGVLNPSLLRWLIDNKLWNKVLDSDRRFFPLITSKNVGDKEVEYYRDIGSVTTGLAPENLNGLFLERKLSASIQSVIDSQDTQKQIAILKVFGRIPKTDEQVIEFTQLHKEMVSLEAYIIDSLYSGFHKLGANGIEFNDGLVKERKVDVERARRYISKGYEVTVSKPIWPKGAHPQEFHVNPFGFNSSPLAAYY